MKILILSNLCPPNFIGGYEVGAFNAAVALDRAGHDIRLLTSTSWHETAGDPHFVRRVLDLTVFTPHPLPDPAVAKYRLLKGQVSNFHNSAVLLDEMARFKPDVIYVFNVFGLGGLALIDILTSLGVPWVWHLMDIMPTVLRQGQSIAMLELFGAPRSLIQAPIHVAMSRRLVGEIREGGTMISEDTTIIPGWVEKAASSPRTQYRQNGSVRFTFAGFIGQHKGVPLIIEAAERLVAEGRDSFIVDAYGPGEAFEMSLRAAELGVDRQVRFHGPLQHDELLEELRNSDCLLFPTWEREPFGFVPLEAAAQGCVPVMTDLCGASERMVDRVHAIKIRRTVDDLYAKMRDIIDGNIDLERIGRAGAAYVNGSLTLGHLLPSIVEVLAEAASMNPSPDLGPAAIDQQRRLQWAKDARAMEILMA